MQLTCKGCGIVFKHFRRWYLALQELATGVVKVRKDNAKREFEAWVCGLFSWYNILRYSKMYAKTAVTYIESAAWNANQYRGRMLICATKQISNICEN